MLTSGSRRDARGFSLIELVVTVSVLGLLLAAALPAFTDWIRNARIRTVAESLQSGVRLAQTEAQRRAQNVVFFLTPTKECLASAVANTTGPYWQVRTVANALLTGSTTTPVQCGVVEGATSVNIAGPAAICFNADGRQLALTDPTSIGKDCAPSDAGPSRYDISATTTSADHRPLRVLVTRGGQVRMCDPAKALASAPDGCPPIPST